MMFHFQCQIVNKASRFLHFIFCENGSKFKHSERRGEEKTLQLSCQSFLSDLGDSFLIVI